MTNRVVGTSPQVYARIGGVVYLLEIATAIFAELFVRSKLIVSGDATATAHNIMASESLWRLGFASDLINVACFVAVALILYVLLRPVNKNLALLAAFFSMAGNTIVGVAVLGHFAALLFLGGADYLKAFDPHQLQALALLSLKLHGVGYTVSMVFFGCYCPLNGYLILRSGYLPKFLGAFLVLGGAGYLTGSFADFLAPAFAARISIGSLAPGAVAELSLALWLLVMGVNVAKWEERASAGREGTA